MPESGRIYLAVNKKSNTVLDLSGLDQRYVSGYHEHGGNNQKVRFAELFNVIVDLISISSWQWRFFQQLDGGWTIQNVAYSRYLDVEIPNTIKEGETVVAIDTGNPREWTVQYDSEFNGWR